MKENKKIRANLNPDVMINEKDRNCYHLRWTYVKVNPADPKHPVVKTEVRPFRAADYRVYFSGNTEKMLKMQTTVGVEEVELVHDPSIPDRKAKVEEIEKPEPFRRVMPEDIAPEPETDEEKIVQARENELQHREAAAGMPGSMNAGMRKAAVNKRRGGKR